MLLVKSNLDALQYKVVSKNITNGRPTDNFVLQNNRLKRKIKVLGYISKYLIRIFMMAVYEKLDSEELFHLAIKASEKKDHDKAISYLKESLALKADANTQYILAAEHAEIGMYERAIEEMQKALLLNPNL